MELLLLLLLLSTPIIFFLSLKLLYYSKPKKCSNLPPGKMGWPFLGETLEFISAGRNGTPEKFFHDRLNRHSPEIFKTSLITEKVTVLGGAAGNKFLFTNENKLVKAWYPRNVEKIFPSSLELSQSDETTKMRKFLPGHLQLREYVGVMDAIAKQHLDSHWDSDGGEITVLPLAKRFAFAVACRLFLSIVDQEHVARLEKPFHAVMAGVSSLPINFPGTKFNRAIGAANLIRKELTKIIRHRKRERETVGRRRDILDHMLTAPGEDGRFMSEPDIADKIIGFLLAGTDSSSSVITFVVKYLADLPQIYDKVFKGIK